MAVFLQILVLVATMFVMMFVEGIFFTLIAWVYHRYGEETEFGPVNFDRPDQESFRKYAGLLLVLVGVASILTHLVGFLFRQWYMSPVGYWYAMAILCVLQFAILAFMIPIQFNTVDQKKAYILAGLNTVIYAILYYLVVGDLLK